MSLALKSKCEIKFTALMHLLTKKFNCCFGLKSISRQVCNVKNLNIQYQRHEKYPFNVKKSVYKVPSPCENESKRTAEGNGCSPNAHCL